MLTKDNKHETIHRKIPIRFPKEGDSTRNCTAYQNCNDTVVEVNIKYGSKYLDLNEMKGRKCC
jgi:hypothetical protein